MKGSNYWDVEEKGSKRKHLGKTICNNVQNLIDTLVRMTTILKFNLSYVWFKPFEFFEHAPQSAHGGFSNLLVWIRGENHVIQENCTSRGRDSLWFLLHGK